MARMTLSEIDTILDAAITAQHIWNVDHSDLKDRLSYLLDQGREVAQKAFLAVPERQGDFNEIMNDLYYSHGYPATFNSIIKRVAKATIKGVPAKYQPALKAYQDYVAEFGPICKKFVSVKPFVVKGRKPSTDPRKTPERTIDNTGTCSVCGQNVKLSGGKIVMHGYEVKWNSFQGQCPGVGFDAFEISPVGAVAYKDSMEAMKVGREEALADLPNVTELWKESVFRGQPGKMIPKNDPAFQQLYTITKGRLEGDIRHLGHIITDFEKKITRWVAKALPDGNTDHMKG